MAAREKTRDELDMQTLRELASLQPNKFCFDCGQRGTTYVNVTIGSFVCSACGGLLRGLNPPHRVKSLTVCSFTEVEMDRLKSRGNEYCTQIWLGRYDPKTSEVDLNSPDKRKEFMIQKYEDKKYYVDPKEAIKKMKPRAPAVPITTSSAVTGNSVTRSHTVIPNKQPPHVQRPGAFQISQTFSDGDISNKSSADMFKDYDPFKETKQTGNVTDGASFADFSSAFGSSSTSSDPIGSYNSTATSSQNGTSSHKKPAPPPPDRYAALADLDSKLNQQVTVEAPPQPISSVIMASTNPSVFWSPSPMANVVYAPPTVNPFSNAGPGWSHPPTVTPNPFQPITAQVAVGASILPQHSSNGLPNSVKPSLHNGGGAFWPSAPNVVWGAPYQTVHPDPFLMNSSTVVDGSNPWAQSFGASGANPFSNNSFVPEQNSNAKTNPFL